MIAPERLEIDCVFECPECKAETWLTLTQIENYQKFVCTCCNYVDDIGSITVSANIEKLNKKYEGKKKENEEDDNSNASEPQNTNVKSGFDGDMFIGTLQSLGYKKSAAKKIVEDMAGEYDGDDEQFVHIIMEKI